MAAEIENLGMSASSATYDLIVAVMRAFCLEINDLSMKLGIIRGLLKV